MHRIAVSTTSFLSRSLASVSDFGLCWLIFGGIISALIILSSRVPAGGSDAAALTKFLAVGVWVGVIIGAIVGRRGSANRSTP